MKYIGAHVSAEGGIKNTPARAKALGANAFAAFTRNPRGWSSPPLSSEEIAAFKSNLAASGIAPDMVLPHDNFLINLAGPKEEIAQKSYETLVDEAKRVRALGLKSLNFHPGSRGDDERASSIARIGLSLKRIMAEVDDVVFVVEMTAGQGAHLGRSFEDIIEILDATGNPSRMGVCIDTCHIFAAGYDIRTEETYATTMEAFDRIVGGSFLRAMHLNDSVKDLNEHVDRHASLGNGRIGLKAFECIMKDARTDGIPLILETPDSALWSNEIQLLRSYQT